MISINGRPTPIPVTHDFRSHTLTTPTPSMLSAILPADYHDDGYAEDPATNALEAYIARLTGKDAALLVMLGVMGNQVCIRTNLTQPPYSNICDYRSRIVTSEAGGVSSVSGAMSIAVTPQNGRFLTLEDVQRQHVPDNGKETSCTTRLICLENTLCGTILPLREARSFLAHSTASSSHALINSLKVPGSVALCPESGFITIFDRGMALCRSQAASGGQTISYRPLTIAHGICLMF